jgi:hypothetical protein
MSHFSVTTWSADGLEIKENERPHEVKRFIQCKLTSSTCSVL